MARTQEGPMAGSSSRGRLAELADSLRKSTAAEAQMVVEMTRLLAEEARQALVSADGDDMLRAQGAARAFDRLHRQLTTAPPMEDR